LALELEDGRAVGVRLADGKRIADTVLGAKALAGFARG
jgi:hypothetical protein